MTDPEEAGWRLGDLKHVLVHRKTLQPKQTPTVSTSS